MCPQLNEVLDQLRDVSLDEIDEQIRGLERRLADARKLRAFKQSLDADEPEAYRDDPDEPDEPQVPSEPAPEIKLPSRAIEEGEERDLESTPSKARVYQTISEAKQEMHRKYLPYIDTVTLLMHAFVHELDLFNEPVFTTCSPGILGTRIGMDSPALHRVLSDPRTERFVHRIDFGKYELTEDGKEYVRHRLRPLEQVA
jgi:hypothetical protein